MLGEHHPNLITLDSKAIGFPNNLLLDELAAFLYNDALEGLGIDSLTSYVVGRSVFVDEGSSIIDTRGVAFSEVEHEAVSDGSGFGREGVAFFCAGKRIRDAALYTIIHPFTFAA